MTPKYTIEIDAQSPIRIFMPKENEIVSDYIGMTTPTRVGMYNYDFILTVRWVYRFKTGTVATEIKMKTRVKCNVRIEWNAQSEIATQIIYDTLSLADQKVLLYARRHEPIFDRVPHRSEEQNRKCAIDLLSSLYPRNN